MNTVMASVFYIIIVTTVGDPVTPISYQFERDKSWADKADCETAGREKVATLKLNRTGHEALADKAIKKVITYGCIDLKRDPEAGL